MSRRWCDRTRRTHIQMLMVIYAVRADIHKTTYWSYRWNVCVLLNHFQKPPHSVFPFVCHEQHVVDILNISVLFEIQFVQK